MIYQTYCGSTLPIKLPPLPRNNVPNQTKWTYVTGESLLSPVVECGPRGLEFKVPVDLRIPHNATPAHKLALKAIDTEAASSSDWLDVKLPEPTSDHILVKLDHF